MFTTVSIAVPLTANMYSLKFLEFFLKDRVNSGMLLLAATIESVHMLEDPAARYRLHKPRRMNMEWVPDAQRERLREFLGALR